MESPYTLIIIAILALSTLCILGAGIILMAMGNKLNERYSNRLMQCRIAAQGITIISLVILLLLHKVTLS